METLSVHLFKDSFGPFIALLNEDQVKCQMREIRSGILMGSSDVVEIVQEKRKGSDPLLSFIIRYRILYLIGKKEEQ